MWPLAKGETMFLDEKIQAQVREMLAPIQNPVEVVVFTTSGLELPGQEVGLQDETWACSGKWWP